ncbi:MAG: DUF4340 domain-containing protein, partial [Clostridia bacterium]|nr:DUF4340 domain-containing protein [Clostridia bacterium]
MKRGTKMILLLCVLAVMICGYYGVQQHNKTESVTETAGSFALTAKNADELTGLKWAQGDTAYAFKYENGVWETAESPAWPADQEVLQDLADQLTGLQATRKLEDVKNEADYGLDTPVITVTASWNDGTSTVYSMGDATPFSDGYYLNLSGEDGTIYTIEPSLSSVFSKTQKDMAALESIPVVTEANRLSVGHTFEIQKKEASTTVDPDQLWYDAAADMPVDGTQAETLITAAQGIEWGELVTAAADPEMLSGWQLEDGQATAVTLSGSDGSAAAVLFGIPDENGDYYARLPGSNMVYTVDGGSVSGLLSANTADMAVTSILPMPYEQLADAVFTTEKWTWQLEKPAADSLQAEEAENAGSETGAGSAAESGTDTTAEDLWKLVTAVKAVGTPETEKEGDPVLSVRAVNTAGAETTVIFSEYSAESYQAAVDGGIPLLGPAD